MYAEPMELFSQIISLGAEVAKLARTLVADGMPSARRALHWDGSSWSDISSTVLGNDELKGVGATGSASGASAVTLVRWQEIISN